MSRRLGDQLLDHLGITSSVDNHGIYNWCAEALCNLGYVLDLN